jgi:hypothetical protein
VNPSELATPSAALRRRIDLHLDAPRKRLSLANTRRSWRDLVARGAKDGSDAPRDRG